MVARKIVSGLFCSTLIVGAFFFCFSQKQVLLISKEKEKQGVQPVQQTSLKKEPKKTYDLYSNTPYDLPLISIYEISTLSDSLKKIIDETLEASQGFYLLKKVNDKVLILMQNPVIEANTFPRHNLQYLELFLDGRKEFHNAGYNGIEGEIFDDFNKGKDVWTYDKSVEYNRPIKHIAKDERGKTKFIEIWNYAENEPVKYLMKDNKGKIISILKETLENESNLRKEHIFYDNDGNIVVSLTVNYDGANITRVTYFNSHDYLDSVTLISEYDSGHKVKELIYNENYVLMNTINSVYKDGVRAEIQVLDSENQEMIKLTS